jgi:hypothetical protein
MKLRSACTWSCVMSGAIAAPARLPPRAARRPGRGRRPTTCAARRSRRRPPGCRTRRARGGSRARPGEAASAGNRSAASERMFRMEPIATRISRSISVWALRTSAVCARRRSRCARSKARCFSLSVIGGDQAAAEVFGTAVAGSFGRRVGVGRLARARQIRHVGIERLLRVQLVLGRLQLLLGLDLHAQALRDRADERHGGELGEEPAVDRDGARRRSAAAARSRRPWCRARSSPGIRP